MAPEKLPFRTITIPDVPMVKVVGHSIGGTKKPNFVSFPSLRSGTRRLPGVTRKDRSRPVPPVDCHQHRTVGSMFSDKIASPSAEIVDRVSQHAMAPNRALSNAYDDEPTQVRAKAAGVRTYHGPSTQFPAVEDLKSSRLYPILEQRSNWIKIATDKTHSAWVDQNSVELVR